MNEVFHWNKLCNTRFPLYQIGFYLVLERITFNGTRILFWTNLGQFLFWFETKDYLFQLALTSVNKFWNHRNHPELSVSRMEWNISLLEVEGSNCYLIQSSCWVSGNRRSVQYKSWNAKLAVWYNRNML